MPSISIFRKVGLFPFLPRSIQRQLLVLNYLTAYQLFAAARERQCRRQSADHRSERRLWHGISGLGQAPA
jgi:hypothetical protein